ncbi:MAG: GCN5-related N-acetyltransferase [Blastococcus sp.]|nr:GCN5-related N-acetyltransferase [Blastococcus sp.]
MGNEVRPLTAADAGELLTLQRAAFVTEAQLYDDVRLPALVQSLDELRAELAIGRALGVRLGGRVVGAVRTRQDDAVLHVNRLTVAPDLQGRGLGSQLLAAAETGTDATEARLFTGHRSAGNLRLYERFGYVEDRREVVHAGLTLVYLSKRLRS